MSDVNATRNSLVLSLLTLRRTLTSAPEEIGPAATRLADWAAANPEHAFCLPEWLSEDGTGELVADVLMERATGPEDLFDPDTVNTVVGSVGELLDKAFSEWAGDPALTAGRLPIGVVDPLSGNVLSLTADLVPAAGPTAVGGGLNAAAEAAMTAARAAVRTLLEPVVDDLSPLDAVLALPGAVAGIEVGDAELALPLALALLARFFSPERGVDVVAAGSLEDDGVVPLDEEGVRARLKAAGELGRGLLVATKDGWAVRRSADSALAVVKTTRHDLAEAARVLWGDEWEQWMERRRAAALRALGWSTVDLDAAAGPDQPVPDTEIHQVAELRNILDRKRDTSVVLGGPTGTAKTTIVRLLARDLRERGWQVVAVAPTDGHLPDEELLASIARIARTRGSRCLLVLDDVAPTGDGFSVDVDDLLSVTRQEEFDVSVLAVLRYDVGITTTEWKIESTHIVQSVVGQSQTMRFARTLVERHPELLGASEPLLTTLVRRYYRDLRELTQMMVRVSEGGPAVIDEDSVRTTVARQRERGDGALEKLAAVSLLNNHTSEDDLYPVTPDVLRALGAVRSMHEDSWRLPHQGLCRDILLGTGQQASGQAADMDAVRREIVVRALSQLINATKAVDDRALVRFLRNARQGDETALRALVGKDQFRDNFADWLERVDITVLADLGLIADRVLSDDLADQLGACLVRRCGDLAADTTRDLGVREMTLVLSALLRMRGSLDSEWQNCLNQLVGPLERILRAAESTWVRDVYRLVELLPKFQHDPITRLVAKHGFVALHGLKPGILRDYGIARRIHRVVKRSAQLIGMPVSPTEQEPSVRALLDYRPRPRHGLPAYLAALSLKLELEGIKDWEGLISERRSEILAALPNSDVRELRFAVAELHASHPAFCVRLLNVVTNLDVTLRNLIRREALPAETALLLQTLTNRHASLAFKVLYTRQQQPDRSLAHAMAKRIDDTGDIKGASMLLTVAYTLDDWKANPESGFAFQLASALGLKWFRESMKFDERPSVLSHLVVGLWRAKPAFADEVLDAAADLVTSSIEYSLRQWGPQLALEILDDVEVAEDFRWRLRGSLQEARMVEGMCHADSSDARAAFHRLARILFPTAPTAYLHAYHSDGIELTGSVSSALSCIVETVRTLRTANVGDTAASVLRDAVKARGNRRVFARLKAPGSPAELADAIRLMARLDRDYAATKVRELGGGGRHSILQRRVRYGMFAEPVGAANLMEAVEHVLPGEGAVLLDVAVNAHDQWHAFTVEVQHMQNPTQQWVISRQLAAVGLRFGDPHTSWMRRVYDSRLSTISQLRSPRFVSEQLRMLHLWDEDWAAQAAHFVDAQRVALRLRSMLVRDMSAVPSMLTVLKLCGATEKVDVIMSALADIDPRELVRRLGVRAATSLLLWAMPLMYEVADGLGVALAEQVGSAVRSYLVCDESDHWSQVGWAAFAVRAANLGSRLPAREPSVPPNLAFAAEVAWAVSQLPDQHWTRSALRDALDRLVNARPQSSSDVFHTLAAASIAKRSVELLVDRTKWAGVADLRLGQLGVLTKLSDRDPLLAQLLHEHRETISEQFDQPLVQQDPGVDRVSDWFSWNRFDLA
ncbi:hypothetical protein GCM10010492_70510 [Saccharothrix mutabilis subsp. mutabilis]|uniref:AAA+ ATPase domain-containing protein n=1 Tax=Saccharothrix mutabilis subsp. mutabilis TaxID=66855 RepID=A0ABN0URS6_9PSEU